MHRLPCLLLFIAGCYGPRISAGAPCSGNGMCPDDQVCIAERCQVLGTPSPDAQIGVTDAPNDAAVWSANPVPGEVNTGSEDDPSCTGDRKTIVFVSKRKGNGSGVAELFIGTRATTGASFTVAELTALNAISSGDKASPEISADGMTIYFTADIGDGTSDVYVSHRTGDTWGRPDHLPELSDPSFNDSDVAISPDGLTAMVARAGMLMIATRAPTDAAFGSPAAVSITVEGSDVASPSITNHADVVYLHAGPTRRLYYTRREAGSYTKPVPISELESPERNSAPFVLEGEHYMLFARGNNIYEATR